MNAIGFVLDGTGCFARKVFGKGVSMENGYLEYYGKHHISLVN